MLNTANDIKTHIFNTKDEFNKARKKIIAKKAVIYELDNINLKKKIIPTSYLVENYLNIYTVKCKLREDESDDFVTFFYRDPITSVYKPISFNNVNSQLARISEDFSAIYDAKQSVDRFILNMQSLTDDKEKFGIEYIKQNPFHLRYFNNGIFDLKSKEFYPKHSDKFNELIYNYDFTSKHKHNYIPLNKANKLYIEIFNRFITDLANNDQNLKLLFMEILFACIEGYGRHVYFMMSGQPGCGKTTFGRFAMILAGLTNIIKFTLDKFKDDNYINKISPSTALVYGDDLMKNANLKGEALTKYKSLIDGNAVQVKVKFEPNKLIYSHAVWLQMMNDFINIHEVNEAIIDRTVMINIIGRNHRQAISQDEISFAQKLDELTGRIGTHNYEFAESIITYIINEVEYFDKFTIPKHIKEQTEKTLKDGSWTYQFVEDLEARGLFENEIIPNKVLVEEFKKWLYENNSSMKMPSTRTLNKELVQVLKEKGFTQSKTQIRSSKLKSWQFNEFLFDDNGYGIANIKNTFNYWVNSSNTLQDDIVENYLDKHNLLAKDYDEFTTKDFIIVDYAVNKLNLIEYADKVHI